MSLRLRLTKRNSRGQSLVETALILPIIVLVLLLGIDLGRVFFTSIDLRNAAHEATMLGGTEPDATCAEIKATVDRQMGRTGRRTRQSAARSGTSTDVVYITSNGCERVDPGQGVQPLGPQLPRQLRPPLSGPARDTASSRSSRSSAS